ncbi:poly-beta-hydroxybutyrate polymerase N-terminal domain-containing protein, partial [Diaphorobacter sp.]|uniref:poly-beta-hydroxybutyrate polymerase N-terminal domain-containing protein n=1 Tax=Diaphorobacter sp. TaxID=1934310 RepID=UPI003D0CE4AE
MDSTPDSEQLRERQRQAAQALDETVHTQLSRAFSGLSPIALALAHADWALHLMASPGRQAVLAQQALDLSLQAWNASLPQSGEPHEEKDARFTDPSWNHWPFRAFKAGYKATDAWWRAAAQQGGGISRHNQHLVNFFTGQALEAISPSNWLFTNPEVLNAAQASRGATLQDGMQFFMKDLQEMLSAGPDTDPQDLPPLKFAVGKDVAVTP